MPLYLKPSYISACVVYLWKITIHLSHSSYSAAALCHYLMCPILLEDTAGTEMGRKTEGHQRMLCPAVSPEAYCPRLSERAGRPRPWKLSLALTCYIKPGDGESIWL